jgi:hypothetical protein
MREIVSPLSGIRSPFSGRRAFSPLSLFAAGELGGAWDLSNFTTMFQDTAATTPVTAAAQAILRINDLSPNGLNLTQSTNTSAPVLQQNPAGFWNAEFDGVDDWWETATITNSINADKVQIIAGFRQTAAFQAIGKVLVELSANIALNNNVFNLIAPAGTATNARVRFSSKGTQIVFADATSASYDPPVTLVAVGLGEIATPRAELILNNTSIVINTAAQTGTVFSNHPLYVGRRGTGTSFFTGNLHRLIVRMATTPLTPAQLANAVAWVNAGTGAY